MIEWSTLKKLIWLKKQGGAALVWNIVTGVSPLSLPNAIAHAIRSLIQYGKCETVNGDIYCNNGKLTAVDDELPEGYKRLLGITFDGNFYYKTGEALAGSDDVTMTLDNLSSSGKNVFGSYNGANDKNFSLYIYGSSTSGSYFRYGDQLKRPKYGGTGRRTITFGASGTTGFAEDSTVDPDTFTTPDNVYIGMLPNSSSPGYTGDILGNILVGTRLKWIPVERESDGMIGYYERVKGNFIAPTGSGTPVSLGYDASHLNVLSVVGTPEVLTIGEQTASVENLFEVNGVADEQDIISGVITRKVGVSVVGGVITLSALSAPVTEHTTPQPLSTVEGDNTVSWTAEVSGTVKEVEYAYEAPSFEWKTASGAVVNVSDAIAGEVGALTVSINPVQSGAGDPSPDNVRPISGHSAVNVFHSGKNLLKLTGRTAVTSGPYDRTKPRDFSAPFAYIGITANNYFNNSQINSYTASDTSIIVNPKSSGYGVGLNVPCKPNTQYVFSFKNKAINITGIGFYDKDGLPISDWYINSASRWKFTTPANCVNMMVVFRPSTNADYTFEEPQLELGETETAYASPETSTISVTIPTPPGTVYGGTLDVLTGMLTVDKVKFNFTGTESWGYLSSADGFFYCSLLTAGTFVSGNYITENGVKMYLNANNGQARVYLSNNTFLTSSSDMHDYCKSGIGFVYPLSTPQTVQLTPAQVSTLLGTNVIWASGNGEISVTYRAEASE